MIKRRNNQKGLTLLEYCAGAAIIGVVVFAVIRAMGGHLETTGENVGNWAEQQSNKLPDGGVLD
jgi:Flp pilus assembly pilin Flp